MRKAGTHRSTAEVIEAVRLARTLSALKDGSAPTLRDLRDAAVTLIGYGERRVVAEALASVDVGTAIGELPKGVSQTSIQEDFERRLSNLKLEKYKTTVAQELTLDLRENRRVKSEEAAFLDLHRSSFFHQLRVLEIGFAKWQASGQQSTTWAEKWLLQWTPENEIALVEAVLLGETVELATGFKFKTQLEACTSIAEASQMVSDACQCGMMGEKRCQEPFVSGFRGLPRGRSVISRSSCLAMRWIQSEAPNGEPRATLRRRAANSASDCGCCKWLSHNRGRATGHSLKTFVAISSCRSR